MRILILDLLKFFLNRKPTERCEGLGNQTQIEPKDVHSSNTVRLEPINITRVLRAVPPEDCERLFSVLSEVDEHLDKNNQPEPLSPDELFLFIANSKNLVFFCEVCNKYQPHSETSEPGLFTCLGCNLGNGRRYLSI